MTMQIEIPAGTALLAELQEFANFSAEEQYYIRRSLEVAFGKGDPVARWSRNRQETLEILAQGHVYSWLGTIRDGVPLDGGSGHAASFFTPLVAITDFDLGLGHLGGFGPYRFLYERLLGAAARPWLPSAFCAAAALPHHAPSRRAALIASVADGAEVRWSPHEPAFYPEWVDC
jgi:hypothetical protein